MRLRASIGQVIRVIGPGLLVAATGVGAGDLATAAFAGNALGTAVLWAVALGAAMKYSLTEGLTRWQLGSQSSLIQGLGQRIGKPALGLFFAYLLLWSFFVGSALTSACAVATAALLPIGADGSTKLFCGAAHSALAFAIVRWGGYGPFTKVIDICVALMFALVALTAIASTPDWLAALRGLCVPKIPQLAGQGLTWTIALVGGVGGTVTILCYGYWIREEGRSRADDLRTCRIDLAVGYAATALFGMAMLLIGSQSSISGTGASLLADLGDRLQHELGPLLSLCFRIGAWTAVFSSLLGVWQSVPYLFADTLRRLQRENPNEANATPAKPIDTANRAYRAYLCAISLVPLLGMRIDFRRAQKLYAIVGALFVPLLAAALLRLNGGRCGLPPALQNRARHRLALLVVLAFFGTAAWLKLR